MVTASTGGLTEWLHHPPTTRARGHKASPPAKAGLRFAFYGRVSTADRQEPAASRAWQREVATQTIGTAGSIVRDFFDVGCSRSIPWLQRPEARSLLDAVRDPERGFDAIIVGESDRAFSGTQLQQVLPALRRYRVALWLPELDGPLDPDNPVHQALVLMLGHDARREVLRARHRTLTAMRVLARVEGRFLGGRPPYGYRLVDAGPHPNLMHASWGRRLNRLDPDPATAGHVRWIFQQRLTGLSPLAIAGMLTRRGIACPSAADPDRNPHRAGHDWSRRAIDTILGNPRYTGRQVYGRRGTDHHETSPGARHTGEPSTRRANTRDQWVVSGVLAHPPLISEAMFVSAQRVSSIADPLDGQQRCYLLAGLVICTACGRRAESQWVSGRAAYRCRHGHRGARPAHSPLPFYAREDALLTAAATQLDALTGGGQTLWDPAAVAGYLRARKLTLHSTRDGVTLHGKLPEQAALPIPGIFGVDRTNTIGVIVTTGDYLASTQRPQTTTPKHRKPRRITARLIPQNDR